MDVAPLVPEWLRGFSSYSVFKSAPFISRFPMNMGILAKKKKMGLSNASPSP
jgi:hypothetical protein